MMKLLLPLLLVLAGLGAGVGAGLAPRPDAQEEAVVINPCGDQEHAEPAKDHKPEATSDPSTSDDLDYVKLNNQFVVPVVSDDLVEALVVMSLSVEIAPGFREFVYAREPKLRDALLQVMFDHANMGGFEGAFTDANTLDVLR